jgi:hypothetical protein
VASTNSIRASLACVEVATVVHCARPPSGRSRPNMDQEDVFMHGDLKIRYTRHSERTSASARFTPKDGRERKVELNAQSGGGAHVSSVPDDALDAVTALSFHIWPRVSKPPRGWSDPRPTEHTAGRDPRRVGIDPDRQRGRS